MLFVSRLVCICVTCVCMHVSFYVSGECKYTGLCIDNESVMRNYLPLIKFAIKDYAWSTVKIYIYVLCYRTYSFKYPTLSYIICERSAFKVP